MGGERQITGDGQLEQARTVICVYYNRVGRGAALGGLHLQDFVDNELSDFRQIIYSQNYVNHMLPWKRKAVMEKWTNRGQAPTEGRPQEVREGHQ